MIGLAAPVSPSAFGPVLCLLVVLFGTGCPDDSPEQPNGGSQDLAGVDEPDISEDASVGDVVADEDSGSDDPVETDLGDAVSDEDAPIDLSEDRLADAPDDGDDADLGEGDADLDDAGDTDVATDMGSTDLDVRGGDLVDAADLLVDITDVDVASDSPVDLVTEEMDMSPPSPPTSVSASDGTNPDFVAISWPAMENITEFRILRDGVQVGSVSGDATFFWDHGADPSVPKAVAPVASQGEFADKVVVTWSAVTADAGTVHSYTVRAANAYGESIDSAPDTGFRETSAVTHYQISLDSGAWVDVHDVTYVDTTAAGGTFQVDSVEASTGRSFFGVLLDISGHPIQGAPMDYALRAVNAVGFGTEGTTLGFRLPQPTYQWQYKVLDAFEDIPGATHTASWDPYAPVNGESRDYQCEIALGDGRSVLSGLADGYRDITRILAEDGLEEDRFGQGVAISDEWAVIGAPYDDIEDAADAGSVHIYHYDPTAGWSLSEQLSLDSATGNEEFGYLVATWGDRVVVGAPGVADGTVFVYRYARLEDEPSWKLETDWVPGDGISRGLAIFGEWIIAGSETAPAGSAHLLHWTADSGWEDAGELDPDTDLSANARFGHTVAIDENRAVVGAFADKADDVATGAAYVFRYQTDSGWSEEDRLVPSDGWDGGWFGSSVDISGDLVLVGAERNGTNGTDSGSAYVYRYDRDSAEWIEEAQLFRPEAALNQSFGISVAIDREHALVGSSRSSSTAAILFRRGPDRVWVPTELAATAGEQGFGWTVAANDGWALVGTPFSDESEGDNQGAVTVFWPGRTQGIPDTGQSSCYYFHEGSGAWREDPACSKDYTVGSPLRPYGQDAHYPQHPNLRSFAGPTEDTVFTDDFTTADLVTGLVWRSCAEGQWDSSCSGGADFHSWDEWALEEPCASLNAQHDGAGYAGRVDWRMPSVRELSTLMPLDMGHFPGADTRRLWSSTPPFVEPEAFVFGVHLDETAGQLSLEPVGADRAMQCVAGPRFQTRPYDLSREGAVIDVGASLLWQRCGAGRIDDPACTDDVAEPDVLSRAQAFDYCETLILAGREDWRVPNLHELVSLFARIGIAAEAVNGAVFPESAAGDAWFWLATSAETDEPLIADPRAGTVEPVGIRHENRVLCVTDL